MLYNQSMEGLLSTAPTPSSFLICVLSAAVSPVMSLTKKARQQGQGQEGCIFFLNLDQMVGPATFRFVEGSTNLYSVTKAAYIQ